MKPAWWHWCIIRLETVEGRSSEVMISMMVWVGSDLMFIGGVMVQDVGMRRRPRGLYLQTSESN